MAVKTDLRTYQLQIFERLHDASVFTRADHLGFVAGGQHWLAAVHTLEAALPSPPIVPVKLVRNWFIGVTNSLGELYCVTDLSAFLTGTSVDRSKHTRGHIALLILHESVMEHTALLVESVLGLYELKRFKKVTTDDGSDGYEDESGTTWNLFDAERFVKAQAFMEVAA